MGRFSFNIGGIRISLPLKVLIPSLLVAIVFFAVAKGKGYI